MALHWGGRGPGHLSRRMNPGFSPLSLFPSGADGREALPIGPVGPPVVGATSIFPADAITAGMSYRAAIANANTYYVKPSTGNDTTGTGTSGAPFATIAKALRTATGSASRVALLEDCVIPSFDLRSTDASQTTQQFKYVDANGFNVIVRDSGTDLTTQTWTQDGTYSNWWKTTITVSGSQQLRRVLRTDQTDAEGYAKGLAKLTSAPASNGTTPSFYWDNTGKVVWVNLGGSSVEASKAILKGLYSNSAGTSRIFVSGASLGLKGLRMEGVQIVLLDAASRRPEIWLENVTQLWATSKGCDMSNAGWYVATNSRVHASEADGANAFTPSAVLRGLILTANCRYSYSGDTNVFAADGTIQGVSAHGGSDHVSYGTTFAMNNGQGVADTCAANKDDITWLYGCAVTGGATTAPNYQFGSAAATCSRKAYLDNCTSTGAPAAGDLTISANATVYTRNTTLASVTGGSVVPY